MWEVSYRRLFLHFALLSLVSAVFKPPAIVKEPLHDGDVYFKPGDSVQLTCIAEGSPTPTYSWTRNGLAFDPSGLDDRVVQRPGEGTIIISPAEAKDEAVYQCSATNCLGVSLSNHVILREAKLQDFYAMPSRTLRPSLGEPLTLPCVPPQSVPWAHVFWAIIQPDGSYVPVHTDDRVTRDLEDRLRFTNVIASDEQEGNGYACIAQNSITGTQTQSSLFYIHPLGDIAVRRPATYLWATQNDILGLRGDTLTIKCIFAGSPTPSIAWSRTDGHSMADNAHTASYGQQVIIQNLDYGDDGSTYECVGTNNLTSVAALRSFSIRVHSRPSWVCEPRDVEAGVGGQAEVNCLTDAVPQPSYFWFINGVPLDEVTDPRITSERFHRPEEHRVTFSGLTLDDSMVIQCNATNRHGHLWADVTLTVLDSPCPVGYSSRRPHRCHNINQGTCNTTSDCSTTQQCCYALGTCQASCQAN